jgi:hypothetical protein
MIEAGRTIVKGQRSRQRVQRAQGDTFDPARFREAVLGPATGTDQDRFS